MKHFSRGDFVRIGETKTFGVVREVMILDNEIKYVVLNIEGEIVHVKGILVKEIIRVRHG